MHFFLFLLSIKHNFFNVKFKLCNNTFSSENFYCILNLGFIIGFYELNSQPN